MSLAELEAKIREASLALERANKTGDVKLKAELRKEVANFQKVLQKSKMRFKELEMVKKQCDDLSVARANRMEELSVTGGAKIPEPQQELQEELQVAPSKSFIESIGIPWLTGSPATEDRDTAPVKSAESKDERNAPPEEPKRPIQQQNELSTLERGLLAMAMSFGNQIMATANETNQIMATANEKNQIMAITSDTKSVSSLGSQLLGISEITNNAASTVSREIAQIEQNCFQGLSDFNDEITRKNESFVPRQVTQAATFAQESTYKTEPISNEEPLKVEEPVQRKESFDKRQVRFISSFPYEPLRRAATSESPPRWASREQPLDIIYSFSGGGMDVPLPTAEEIADQELKAREQYIKASKEYQALRRTGLSLDSPEMKASEKMLRDCYAQIEYWESLGEELSSKDNSSQISDPIKKKFLGRNPGSKKPIDVDRETAKARDTYARAMTHHQYLVSKQVSTRSAEWKKSQEKVDEALKDLQYWEGRTAFSVMPSI